MSIIVNGIELTEVIYAGVNLDTVKVKKGTAEAVTVFEKMTQLATPQNVTANGTVVSWDEVENATSYEVLADGTSIGTVLKPEPETAVGTWLFKNTVGFSPFSGSGDKVFGVTMTVTDTNGNTYQMRRIRVNYGTVGFVDIYGTNGRPYIAYYSNSANGFSGLNTYCSLTLEDDSHSKIDKTTERGIALRTVTITGGSDATNSDFITWLKANATKQS